MLHDDGLEMLSEAECHDLLAHHSVGRVAVTVGGLPAVFPVNYVIVDGDIVFKTGEGTKLAAALRHAVVAFQVDEIDRLYHEGWSVLAVGTAEVVTDPDDLDPDQLPLAPWAGGTRSHVVRIRPELVSGRRIVRHVEHVTPIS
jgi:uncharacterized protein